MSEVIYLRQIIQVKKQRANSYATVDLINADGSIKKQTEQPLLNFQSTHKIQLQQAVYGKYQVKSGLITSLLMIFL